jgi:hypothetical protein
MFQTKFVEKIKTHFLFNNNFQNRVVDEIMWKNMVRDGEATDNNMVHAHSMLDTSANTHSEYVKVLLSHCNNG